MGLPAPKISEETRAKLSKIGSNKRHTQTTKDKLSIFMKERHALGKAWNIGMSRWNNKPSWPEIFFMAVITNEFEDKNYIREYPFNKYSLDFAWVHKKKCIEIDGEQHQRFEDYKIRDSQKDNLLLNEGWEILRIPWIKMFHNPKEWIQKAKEFIAW